jgi:hypothetical protein
MSIEVAYFVTVEISEPESIMASYGTDNPSGCFIAKLLHNFRRRCAGDKVLIDSDADCFSVPGSRRLEMMQCAAK